MADTEERPSVEEETIPVLHVDDVQRALPWYGRLGFVQEWEHRYEPDLPVFTSLRRGPEGFGVRICLSEHSGDAVPNGLVHLRVADIEPVAAEFGVPIEELDGRREIRIEDPDGNRFRVGCPAGHFSGAGYTFPDRA